MRLAVLAFVIGCSKPVPEVELDPVSVDEAKAFSGELAKVALPCDVAKVRPLFDDQAMVGRYRKGTSDVATTTASWQLEHDHVGATVLCAWQDGAIEYKLLRVRQVDGQPRPLFRRLVKQARDGLTAVGYEDLMLGKSKVDHKVRIVDIFSYIHGGWLTDRLRGFTDAVIDTASDRPWDANRIGEQVERARSLQKQGRPAEALAELDALPATIRNSRTTQMMRVAVASAISDEKYKAALDELAAVFPNDPSIALIEIDGAFMRNDFDAAVHYIDLVDTAVGGDPFQDAIRAEALLQRKKPGDLARAAQAAKRATATEPTLEKGWWSVLDVALAQQDWPSCLAAMDEITHRFGIAFDDAALRNTDVYAGLVRTKEYAAWRKAH